MLEIQARREVPAAADEVWPFLRAFDTVGRYVAAIDHCDVSGREVGATRVCVLEDGGRLVERLDALDDAARSLTTTMLSGPLRVDACRATLSVEPESSAACTVAWTVACEVEEAAEQVEATVRAALEAGLERLRMLFLAP
jgi:hypothetical protein